MVVLLVLAFIAFAVATIATLVTTPPGGRWAALVPLGLALWVAAVLAPHVGLH